MRQCQWTELAVTRAYRDDRGLYYRVCKQTPLPDSAFCSEHKQRFDFLLSRPRPDKADRRTFTD